MKMLPLHYFLLRVLELFYQLALKKLCMYFCDVLYFFS
jgi:hypothetical protein